MKKILTWGLFMLLAAILCVSALADGQEYGPYTQGYFTYYVTNNESGDITFLRITDYYGRESTVTVPDSIAGAPVDLVESNAFSGTSVTTVYLPAYTVFDPPEGILAVRQKSNSAEDGSQTPGEESKDRSSYDLDGDEKVNVKDLVVLLKYIMGYSVNMAETAEPDINHSGEVNLADCLVLLRYLCARPVNA